MNQEEKAENIGRDEDAADSGEGNAAADAEAEIDNLPVESIGSYARVEELLTDDEAENTTARNSDG